MGVRENECQILQNLLKKFLHIKIFRILPMKSQFLWNLTFIFLDFHEKFSLVLLQMIYYIFALEKCKKECNIL